MFCRRSDLRKHEIRSHNRTKRDYIGGEPTYKQVERMQKMQDENHDLDKWRHEIAVTQPTQIVQTSYMEPNKDYMSNSHQIYCFSDVTAVIQSQTQPMGKCAVSFHFRTIT